MVVLPISTGSIAQASRFTLQKRDDPEGLLETFWSRVIPQSASIGSTDRAKAGDHDALRAVMAPEFHFVVMNGAIEPRAEILGEATEVSA